MSLGKSFNFPEPQFPHLIEFFCRLKNLIKVKCLKKTWLIVILYVLPDVFIVIFVRPSHLSCERSGNDDNDINWTYMPGFIVRDITCIDSLTLRLCPMKWILVFCFVRKLRNKGVEKWCKRQPRYPGPRAGPCASVLSCVWMEGYLPFSYGRAGSSEQSSGCEEWLQPVSQDCGVPWLGDWSNPCDVIPAVWHCPVESLHSALGASFQMVLGLLNSRETAGGLVVGGRWARAERKCLACQQFSGRFWAWPREFQNEVTVGGQNQAGRSLEL